MNKKKAMISTAAIIAFQRVKEAGMEEFTRNPLYQFQQSSKKIRNKEGIGKDECPNGHSLKANLNPSYLSYFANTNDLIPIHLFFQSLI